MESKSQLGNELGAIKYVSELTGMPIKKTANIFILLIIFVFDPLAIVLIIATNQSFKNLQPKLNIYEEPKPTPPTQEYQPDPAIEQEKQNIIEEIGKIQNSSKGSSFSRSSALNTLNNRLSSLNDDNTKTY